MNLLKETEHVLNLCGKTFDDINWIGGKDFRISVENFRRVAKDLDYDAGYGSSKIAEDLVIVLDNVWLTRGEYDGSEWWTIHRQPSRPLECIEVDAISVTQSTNEECSCGWESLGVIAGKTKKYEDEE